MSDVIRTWFLSLCVLGIFGFVATVVRFWSHRSSVEKQIGPVPIPAPLVAFIVAGSIIATGFGELALEWWAIRLLGVLLSIISIVLIPWTAWTLGHLFIPGAAVLKDHELVTVGPFALVRHPLLAAIIVFWIGAAIGTLNWLLLILWIPLLGATQASSRHEDALLREKFGHAHELYESRTGRFFPRLRGRAVARSQE